MDILEAHVRALYRILNHGSELSDCRCLYVDGPLWDARLERFLSENGRDPDEEEKKRLKVVNRTLTRGEDEFVKWVSDFNGQANCFVGRNPRNADGTVSRLTTYSFDIDPVRPKGTAATPELAMAAILAGRAILADSPGGYLAESGNGSLVLYRLAVPAGERVKDFERWLSGRQDDLQRVLDSRGFGVKVDATHDSARIVKIPGTISTKGDRALWRYARFVNLPSTPYLQVGWEPPKEEPKPLARRSIGGRPITENLKLALDCLPRLSKKRCEDYAAWLEVGMALRELGDTGLQLWDGWSRQSDKYGAGICAAKWNTMEQREDGVGLGSLKFWADQDNPRSPIAHADPGAAQPLDEFLTDIPEVNWICRPLFARGTIGFIAGLPKTYKTWSMMDLAIECAKPGAGERRWLGLFKTDPAKVMFIDQERFKGETGRRLRDLVRAKGLNPKDLHDTLTVRSGTSIKIDLEHSYQAFKAELLRLKPDLVIIDSFATFHTRDENHKGDIQQVFERLKTLRNETGAGFVFIDHENKYAFSEKDDAMPMAGTLSGSVGKLAAAEFMLTVRRYDQNTCAIHHTATNLGPTVPSFYVRVNDVPSGGIAVTGEI